jgi:CRP-like cAMP-binding protein
MALEEGILRVLRQTPVLLLLDDDALRMLVNVADMRRLRTDEILFRAGERSDGGFVVLAGAIAVGREGDDDRLVLGPGSLVGQTAMFLRMQRPATATALELSDVMRVSPTLMRRILQQFPEAADRIRDHLAGDLGALSAELEALRTLLESMEPDAAAA